MIDSIPLIEDHEDNAEAQALAAAIAESDADPRTAPHDEVRAWLLRIATGEFDALPPEPVNGAGRLACQGAGRCRPDRPLYRG